MRISDWSSDVCSSDLELARFNNGAWEQLQAARATSLFETPVEHFLVRAFLADGMDEVMAHMTAIEAALGLEMDHKTRLRPKPDPHKNVSSATGRVAARITAIIDRKSTRPNPSHHCSHRMPSFA